MSDPEDRIKLKFQHLKDRCEQEGHWVSLDDRVYSQTVEKILGKSGRTLQRWREAGEGPYWYRGGQVTYCLWRLAMYIEIEMAGQTTTKVDIPRNIGTYDSKN